MDIVVTTIHAYIMKTWITVDGCEGGQPNDMMNALDIRTSVELSLLIKPIVGRLGPV